MLGILIASHHHISGLLGEKVGGSWIPIDMVLAAGMVMWIQLEKQVKPSGVHGRAGGGLGEDYCGT